MIAVHRALGALLPDHLVGEHVSLRIGRNLSPPIPDLELLPGGLVATLAFGGVPFTCAVPWLAIAAVASDAATAPQPTPPPKPRHLKAV